MSSYVQPTNVSLIYAPILLLIMLLKFDTPAKRAKLVASIRYGQILPMMTDIGKKTRHFERTLETYEVNMIIAISGIPHSSFFLKTKSMDKGAIRMQIAAFIKIMLWNSHFLKYELKSCVPTIEHA